MPTKEAKARILINDHLQRSGWRFFDDRNGAANIALETNVKLKKKTLDAFGEDFEQTANGYVDYLLLDERGFPIAVLEAKSEKHDPLVGVLDIIETREFSRLADNPKVSLADFRNLDEWRHVIPEYVKDYVHLNQFM